MQAQLWTYWGEELHQVDIVEVDADYDGDHYGDKVHFSVGSNQTIITDAYDFRCERCCGVDPDYVANPYHSEMYNETCMEWLCDDCYRSIQGDI